MIYSIIMFLSAGSLIWVGVMMFKGKDLVMNYHEVKVKIEEKKIYLKKLSIGLFVMALGMLVSGIIPLFSDSTSALSYSMTAFIIGIVASFGIIGYVQVRYNRGLF